MEQRKVKETEFTSKYVSINKETNTLILEFNGTNTDVNNHDVITIQRLIGTLDRFSTVKIYLDMPNNVPVELIMIIAKASNYCSMELYLTDEKAYNHLQKLKSYNIFNFKIFELIKSSFDK